MAQSLKLLGAIVHYVVQNGYESQHGTCRPACVVNDWDHSTEDIANNLATVNVVVFRDGRLDSLDASVVEWQAGVPHSADHQFGSWHLGSECHRHTTA